MAKYKVKSKECQLIVKLKLSFKEKLNERQLDFFSSKSIRGLLKAKLVRKGTIEYTGPNSSRGKYQYLKWRDLITNTYHK